MSLKIYESADPSTSFSVSGVFTNPYLITFDGSLGGVIEQKLYLRNDSILHTYDGISMQLEDNSGSHLIDGTEGFSWKLSEGNDRPLEAAWSVIDAANTITFSGISESTTYLPFWIRAQIPRATPVQSFDQILFKTTATETLIP